MEWKDIGRVVQTAAPVLGSVLLGPPGTVLGSAVGMLLGKLGLGSDAKADDVAAMLQNDPASMLKLKELEMEHESQLLRYQTAQMQAQLEDVQSARQHEVDLAKVGHVSSYGPVAISGVVVFGFFAVLGMLMFGTIPTGVESIMNIMLGALTSGFASVISYYIGSSSDSARKTSIIAMADSIKGKLAGSDG